MRRGLTLVAAVLLAGAPSARGASSPVAVFPSPATRFATPTTQITFRGIPASQIGAISVTGSSSGAHTGTIKADSDGRGGSFLPDKPFAPGEQVTVATHLTIIGAPGGTFQFTIQTPAGNIGPPSRRSAVAAIPGSIQHFVSAPALQPAAIRVLQRSSSVAPGDFFLDPQNGPLQYGPMIIDSRGSLVWFDPLPPNQVAMDLRVQRYRGQPVLTWWQGWINAGIGEGQGMIVDSHYQPVQTVQAGDGLAVDLHEFTITPQGTALITAEDFVRTDASSVGGPKQDGVFDSFVEEVDIATGLVLFQWDSLDHVPLADSYSHNPGLGRPYDYFHANSVQQASDGNLIVSSRNTWGIYEIDHRTGRVIWQVGGKHPTFKMLPGTEPAFQHHATLYSGGLLSLFDDGASPRVHPQSRGLIERINFASRRVSLVRELDHRPRLVAAFEGSLQRLPGGRWLVGWGQQPYLTEYDSRGRTIFDARYVANVASYRAYQFPWSAQPQTLPALGVRRGPRGIFDAYASWNGATDVAAWRILGGSSPTALGAVARAPRDGFETKVAVHGHPAYLAAQALSTSGAVLATSKPVATFSG